MATDIPEKVPLTCSLSAEELRTRGVENAALFADAQGVHELPDGYRFIFPASAESAQDLLAFILAEAVCCPFFTFDLTFPSPHAFVWLTVQGSEGVKEIVRESLVGKLTASTSSAAGAE
jgi:hypothetical protein